eukprot:TRINITY_DN59056_c0_g1_i1.p1 TRINITY_DN59056_c0_g1~~TRINITY_DN59056_c0_g1_i1.p1  ORF type:complete len:170 (+),score=19.15 TRINITY_DN59056_c0_g1_i1:55-564(+)
MEYFSRPDCSSRRQGAVAHDQVECLLETIEEEFSEGLFDQVAEKFQTPCVCSMSTPREKVGTIQQTPAAVIQFFELLRHEFRCQSMKFLMTNLARSDHAWESDSAGGKATIGCSRDEDGEWRIIYFDIDCSCSGKSSEPSMLAFSKTRFVSVILERQQPNSLRELYKYS